MSRRGQQNRTALADLDAEAHNTLESGDPDNTDPVVGAIRFGMDSIMKIANETIPFCPEDEDELKTNIAESMEAALLQLVKTELTYCQTASIMNEVVEELNLQDNPDQGTKEFLEAIDSISFYTNQRLMDYKASHSQEALQNHPPFVNLKKDLEALVQQTDEDEGADNADAETEAEEVDLDEEGDGSTPAREVIPELDPISKQPLRDPCRNRICRHIYGKASMLNLLKTTPRIRCTAMGCDNRQYIRPADLIDDPILTARVTGHPIPSSSRSTRSGSPPTKRRGRSSGGRRRR